jgi:hypothetical protein
LTVFTKTISNTLRLYGVEPHNKWGALIWGTDVWGQRDVEWTDYKRYSNTLTVSSTQGFKVSHKVSENVFFDTIISRQYSYKISESFNINSAIGSVYRVNNGWYSQKGDTINALSFPTNTFSKVDDPTDNWTIVSSTTTTWSLL